MSGAKTFRLAVLAGDGVGPEVTEQALRVLGACVSFERTDALVGGAAIDACGDPLPAATLELCQSSAAVFLGAVGGPKWDASPKRPEQGLLALRKGLAVYANLRPARSLGLATPLRREIAMGADVLIVRDLAGGVYFGEPRGLSESEGFDTWRQTADQVRAVARIAFAAARQRRKRVTSVDKANVLASSKLWRRVVQEIAGEFPDVVLEHRYVDAMAFELLRDPLRFDVILADNLFGDILSDEAGALVGSLGVLPSASLGPGPALYEPVHGSAPDIAGLGIANPAGAILTIAMLLEHSLGRTDLAVKIELAVRAAFSERPTRDLGGRATSVEFTDAVLGHLTAALQLVQSGCG
ncbi:MAG: 3-isopropylmalate dehydrogenase [Acidobacteriota bacterium]